MPSTFPLRVVRLISVFMFGFAVFSVAPTLISPSQAAATCSCFSTNDIVERCEVLASNAIIQSDRFLTLSCRPPSEPDHIQRYVTGDYAVANDVPMDWTCTTIRIPDDGSRWINEETHISQEEEQACDQVIQEAVKLLEVKDDPEIVKACAKECTPEGMIAVCEGFWNKIAKEAKDEGEDFPQSELDEALAGCTQREPDTQACKAECL